MGDAVAYFPSIKWQALRVAITPSFALDLAHGSFYPTWDPNLDVGYGSPVFGYYAPLPYYWAELFHVLGNDVTASLRLAFAGAIVLGAASMYLLCRSWAGRAAGVVGGVCFATLPYQLHDVYVRGALAESLALSLMPLPLFGLTQLAFGRGRAWLGVVAGAVAAIILCHNISAMLFVPFAGGWCALLYVARRRCLAKEERTRLLLSMAAGVCMGLGLAAFFWVPALLERSFVDTQRAALNYDYHDFFNRVWPPVQATWPVDYRYDPVTHPVRPGLLQSVVASAGAIALCAVAWRDERRRSWRWLAALVPLGAALLALQRAEAAVVWDHLPLARYVQFPYRLLAFVGVISAFLAGFIPLVLRAGVARLAAAMAIGALSLVTSLVHLGVVYTGGLPTDLADERGISVLEVARRNLAGAAASEFTPSWVKATTDEILSSVTEPRSVDDGPSSPLLVRVRAFEPARAELHVGAPAQSTLVLRRFYMPGWHARANGEELAPRPLGDLGLLAVDVPPGEWDLVIEYGKTTLDAIAAGVSLVSLVAIVVWLAAPSPRLWARLRPPMARPASLAALALPAGLMLLPHRPAPPLALDAPASLAPGYELVGARIDPTALSASGRLRIALAIFARRSGADLLFRLDAYDGGDTPVASATMRPWNGPTGYWVAGELAAANLDLALPPGYEPRDLSLTVAAADARQPDVWLSRVALPVHALAPVAPLPYHVLDGDFGDKLLLHGYRLDRPEPNGRLDLNPGDVVDVTLDVLSTHWIGEDQTAFVHLLGPDGRLKAQHDALLGGEGLPTSRWLPGTLVRQQFPIAVPSDAAPGRYRFEAGFYELATMQRLALRDPLYRPAGDSLAFGDVVVR